MLGRIKGRSVYGEVLEVAGSRVNFRPLCPAGGWHHAGAREGSCRIGARPAATAATSTSTVRRVVPVPRGQLSLPGVHK